jgi:type II secretory pathway component PulF
MFERKPSLQNLIDLCRVLRHHLSAGLTLHHAFKQQAERGPANVRPLAGRVLEQVETGASLSAALEPERGLLPPLFLAMVEVGEHTGHVPEMFGALEKHYQLEQQLRRQFWRASLLPMVQFVLAIFLIAGLIFTLGVIGQARGTAPLSVFGLSGGRGAIVFLTVCFGLIGTLWLLGALFLRGPRQAAPIQAVLLRVPSLGPCLYAVVMSRFTMALRLTLDSGLSIVKAVKLSLEATGNAHFVSKGPIIAAALKEGEPLLEALTQSGLFDEHFLSMVAAAEEGGRVPEMMQHQTEYYHEESARRLTTLTKVLSMLVWLTYAGFMVYAIFQIAGIYFQALGI